MDELRAGVSPSTGEDRLDDVFGSLLADVVKEMKVVGDSYGEDGMIANRAVAQAFRYYASSWLADRIKKAHGQARAALTPTGDTPASRPST